RPDRRLLVGPRCRPPPVGPAVAVEDRLGTDVRLEAAARAATALASAVRDGGVPPLAGAAVNAAVADAVGDHRRADAGSDERDDRVPGPAPGTEPHLRLAQRLGAVVDVHRKVGAGTEHR